MTHAPAISNLNAPFFFSEEQTPGSLPEARLVRGPLQVVRGPLVHGPPHH